MDEMFDQEAEPWHPGRYMLGLVAAVVALVVGFGAILAPVVALSDASTRVGLSAWNALPVKLPDAPLSQRTVLLDRDGNPFAEFFAEDRVVLTRDQISENMIDALLATEDDRFYDHGALDTKGFARALVRTAMGNRQGGSTLTQQLVENVLLSQAGDDQAARDAARAQSAKGKVQELRYAAELERTMTKDEILTEYLNTVYFGEGAYGVSAASKKYFGVAASDLSVPQAAVLAGLMKSPVAYDPVMNPKDALTRRNVVLGRMLSTGRIDQTVHDQAESQPIVLNVVNSPNGCESSSYPLYCSFVRRQLLDDPVFGADEVARQKNLYRGGLTITTALKPSVSDQASSASAAAFSPENRVAAGVAVLEPGTGYISALAQSKPYGQGENQTEIVYAAAPAFQPGSTFKAITLANALEQGYDPRSTINAPNYYRSRVSDNPSSGSFRNSGGADYGPIDAYEASKKSVNTFYVQLIERYGVVKTADMAARLGITSLPRDTDRAIGPRQASLTLGAYETSPLQMATAYATFAANGVECTPTSIISARRTIGNAAVEVPATNCQQVLDSDVARTVQDVLTGALTPGGTAEGRDIGRPAFGKTGTTDNNSATWFVGSTPQYTTAVWVGDPRGGTQYPLNNVTAYGTNQGTLFGATVAARVWQDAMIPMHAGLPALALGTPNANQGELKLYTVPDVRGMSSARALTAIIASGYRVKLNPETAPADALTPPDVVVSQDPPGQVSVSRGAEITVTLSAESDLFVKIPEAPK